MLILRARAVPERRELPFLSRAARSSSLTTDSAPTDCRRCACWHAPLQHRRGVRGSERAAQRPDDRVDRPRRCRCEASAQPLHPSTQTRRLVSHTSHWDHCRTPRRSRSSTRRGARDISHPTPFLPYVAPPFPPYVKKTFFSYSTRRSRRCARTYLRTRGSWGRISSRMCNGSDLSKVSTLRRKSISPRSSACLTPASALTRTLVRTTTCARGWARRRRAVRATHTMHSLTHVAR